MFTPRLTAPHSRARSFLQVPAAVQHDARSQQNDPQWVRATPPTTANVKAAFLRTPGEVKTRAWWMRSAVISAGDPAGGRWSFTTPLVKKNERPFEKHADKQ